MHRDIAVSQLHEQAYGMSAMPLNRRDASVSRASGSESGQRPWKSDTPNPISIPSNKPVARGQNPFAGGRMGDTLSKKHTSGNVTASKTIFGQQGFGTTRGTRRIPAPGPSAYTPKNKDAFQKQPVIDIDEEDMGEPVARKARTTSPDPIDSFAEEPPRSRQSSATSSSSVRNPLTFVHLPQPPRRSLPQDGDATRRLQQRAQANGLPRAASPEIIELDDDEPVEVSNAPTEPGPSKVPSERAVSSPPPPRPSTPPARPRQTSPIVSHYFTQTARPSSETQLARLQQQNGKGIVAQAVQRIDSAQENDPKQVIQQVGKERRASGVAVPNLAKPPPMIDLLTQANLPPPGIKNRMKSKGGVSQADKLSQSSGLFSAANTSPGKGKAPAKPRQPAKASSSSPPIVLPLEAWMRGTQKNEEGDSEYWFSFDGEKIEVKPTAVSKRSLFSINVSDGAGSVECTKDPRPDKPVVMSIKTAGASRKDRSLRSEPFTHGAHGRRGTLSFRFKMNHANWQNGEPYDRLVSQMKARVIAGLGAWENSCFEDPRDYGSDDEFNVKGQDSATENEDGAGPSRSRPPSRAEDKDDDQLRLAKYVGNRSQGGKDVPARTLRSNARREVGENSRDSPALDPDELVLVYPPTGAGAINITRGDLKRLEPGQYLNDTLIEFGLKLWLNDYREENPELADQVHVFNSFFYKKLNVKDKQAGYQSVRKWTSKFDLFQKKYIIVPINEHLHWYLAIICNPEYVLQQPPPTPPKGGPAVLTRKRKREEDAEPVVLPGTDEAPTGTRDPTPARSRTGDETDENSVEVLLGDCAISPAAEPSAPADDLGVLMYPPSDPDAPMELDGESTQEVVEIDSAAATKASTLQEPSLNGDPPVTVARSDGSEPDIVEIDDTPMEVDKPPATSSASTAVPVTRFYSTVSKKGKERALSPAVPHPSELESQDAEVDVEAEKDDVAEPESPDTDPNKTWIFTFDSLGSKHPAAANNLALYLQLEAKDKKGIDPANTTPPGKKHALVPAQPNFCDCGVYLIHFVRAFMKDPKRATEIILNKKSKDYSSKEREQDWDAEAVINYRNELMATAESLSDVWKKERAAREEQKRKEAEAAQSGATSEAAAEDSDDEIIVGEIITKPKPANARKVKGKAATAAPAVETKADRLR